MREDAQRNRDRILAVAGELFEQASDPSDVSIDRIAAAAGVGKGTVFRGFGSRSGLILALFEQRSDELFEQLAGPADGVPPGRRLVDVLSGLAWFKVENRVITAAAEASDGNPYRQSAYGRWHGLVESLLAESGVDRSARFIAHALLAAVRSELVDAIRSDDGVDLDTGIRDLVDRVVPPID